MKHCASFDQRMKAKYLCAALFCIFQAFIVNVMKRLAKYCVKMIYSLKKLNVV